MRKRKLQIFLSSTYEDLIDHRLAAMEAILAAGHIPAAMEQFSPGDETAWEKIKAWIDESDAFILILGGRYGSLEPLSAKSYVQLEYDYAVAKKKPFFALVVDRAHHEQRVKEFGLGVDERENPQKYKDFKALVTQRLCGFWKDKKDIKSAIFQKLPEWAQRADLTGWVRGEEATNPEVMNELARLSRENNELRARVSSEVETFTGLTFDELSRLMVEHKLEPSESNDVLTAFGGYSDREVRNLLELYEELDAKIGDGIGRGSFMSGARLRVVDELKKYGLLEDQGWNLAITEDGRRFRNRLVAQKRFAATQGQITDPGSRASG